MDQLHHEHPPNTTTTSRRAAWLTLAGSASTTRAAPWKCWSRSHMPRSLSPRDSLRTRMESCPTVRHLTTSETPADWDSAGRVYARSKVGICVI